MIKVYFDFSDGNFHFNIFSKDVKTILFDSIISLLKTQHHCYYDSRSRSWTPQKVIQTGAIIDDLKAYDIVEISEDDKTLLEDFIYPHTKELSKVKRIPDELLLKKFPPIKGKIGYENFQLEAIRKGITQNRILYNVGIGHGKTYIASMVMGTLLKQNVIDKVLIVCRAEGIENFRLELLRFLSGLITENDIGIVSTENRKIEDYFDKKIIITNYITFRLSGTYYNNKVFKTKAKKPERVSIKFDTWGKNRMVILDEAQSINNYSSLQSHFLHLYEKYFDRKILMSGSIGFKFIHYYSLCKFLVPSMLPYSFSEWTDYVAEKGNYFSKYAITDIKPEKMIEFKEKVIDKLQVTYKDCIELPEHIEKPLYISMNNKLKKMYQKFIDKEFNEIVKGKNSTYGDGKSLTSKFPYLLQICSDPILLQGKTDIVDTWNFTDSPKLGIVESLLEHYIEEENRKVIIWSLHPMILNLLAKHLKKYNPYIIHGNEEESIKSIDRFEEVKKFKKDPKRNLLLSSYVLSTSLNITECSRQIYFDLPLDNDPFEQSKGRIYRIGQKEPVITHYLLYQNSMDVYVWFNILMAKNNMRDLLSSKKEITLADVKTIFNAKVENYM